MRSISMCGDGEAVRECAGVKIIVMYSHNRWWEGRTEITGIPTSIEQQVHVLQSAGCGRARVECILTSILAAKSPSAVKVLEGFGLGRVMNA